jgi:hypothetical protein
MCYEGMIACYADAHPVHSDVSFRKNRTTGYPIRSDGGSPATTGDYPSPRYPELEIRSYEDLLDAARNLVNKEALSWQATESSNLELGARPGTGYGMSDADYNRVLIAVETNYDTRVYEAIADAIREKGIDVDVLSIETQREGIDPWEHDLPGVHFGISPNEIYPMLGIEGVRWWEDVAEANEAYDLLIYGTGGPNRKLDGTDYQRIPWRTEEDLVSPANEFPMPLWELINEKTAEVVRAAEEVRITDPEGTDITFTNYDDEGIYYNRDAPGHIYGHPTYLTSDIDTTGVVAGTLNHAGAYPRVEVELDDAKVTSVEGGGEYGDRWRQVLSDTKDSIQYPGFPDTGLFWLWEVAIGTHPKVSRPPTTNISEVPFPEIERRRSGIIHCGFGLQPPMDPYAAKQDNVPWGHVHIHLNFPTYEAKIPDGSTITLIDNGRLTVLDDPEIRQYAEKFGDPDELLSEDWVPAVPGINTDGEYDDDYANNPASWIESEMTEKAKN